MKQIPGQRIVQDCPFRNIIVFFIFIYFIFVDTSVTRCQPIFVLNAYLSSIYLFIDQARLSGNAYYSSKKSVEAEPLQVRNFQPIKNTHNCRHAVHVNELENSGGATPGLARSNDMAGRSTAVAQALPVALLCFGNSVNRKF